MRNLIIAMILLFAPGLAYAQDVSGTWVGRYQCQQGPNGVSLVLSRVGQSNNYKGVFISQRIPENRNSLSASFSVNGTYYPSTGKLIIWPLESRVRGTSYITVGINATHRNGSISGYVNGRGCRGIHLLKQNTGTFAARPQRTNPPHASRPSRSSRPTVGTRSGITSAQQRSLDQTLDKVIATDASSWVANRYNRGSARNTRIIESNPRTGRHVVRGNYTFFSPFSGNSRLTGWIRIVFNGDRVQCVEYHDFRGQCRALGKNPAAYRALGGVILGLGIAAYGASQSGQSSSGQSSGRRSNCVEVETFSPADGGPDRTRTVHRC